MRAIHSLASHLSFSPVGAVVAIAVIAGLLVLLRERVLTAVGDFLIVQDALQPADVIHVIAGEDYRTDYAIELYQQGYAPKLFFTGGWCIPHGYYHGEHAKERSLAAGVPTDVIAFDDSAVTSTYAEAQRLKEWMDHNPRPVRSVIVVSDPYHMRRASWIYRWVLGSQVRIEMAPVPFSQAPLQQQWWKDQASQRYVRDEYGKLAYNVLRYRLSWGIFQDWLASFDTE